MDKFVFLFSEGIKNLWRHKLTAFSAIFSIFLTLIIAGSLIITSQNTSKVIEYLREKYKIEVFFNDNISIQRVEEIVSSFNKIDGIRSTTIITKNDNNISSDLHNLLCSYQDVLKDGLKILGIKPKLQM